MFSTDGTNAEIWFDAPTDNGWFPGSVLTIDGKDSTDWLGGISPSNTAQAFSNSNADWSTGAGLAWILSPSPAVVTPPFAGLTS